VDFDFGTGATIPAVGNDHMAVRWTGYYTPAETGVHTFQTVADDGVRLYVNGSLVQNAWADQGPADRSSAPVFLTAASRSRSCWSGTRTAAARSSGCATTSRASVGPSRHPGGQLAHLASINGSFVRTWTATDDCGNASVGVQRVTVRDTVAPVLEVPPAIVLECTESTDPSTAGQATAQDNCSANLVIVYSDAVISGTCLDESVARPGLLAPTRPRSSRPPCSPRGSIPRSTSGGGFLRRQRVQSGQHLDRR